MLDIEKLRAIVRTRIDEGSLLFCKRMNELQLRISLRMYLAWDGSSIGTTMHSPEVRKGVFDRWPESRGCDSARSLRSIHSLTLASIPEESEDSDY